ncbi:MAG TPA: hypothetical protein VGN12_26035 [Pirellulales bacterium]
MRFFWTFIPITPAMSYWLIESQSKSSTFSSSHVTLCAPHRPATEESEPEILVLRLSPGYSGSANSKPQYDGSKRGLIRQMDSVLTAGEALTSSAVTVMAGEFILETPNG